MKRRRILLFLLCAFLLLTPITANAAVGAHTDVEALEQETKDGLLAILPDVAKPLLPDPTDKDAAMEAVGFKALFSLLASVFSAESLWNGLTLLPQLLQDVIRVKMLQPPAWTA